jgi:hypothetical protein
MTDEEQEVEGPVEFKYELTFDNGETLEVSAALDGTTLELLDRPVPENAPPWTRLSSVCCSVCELDPGEVEICPVAANLSVLVERFGQRVSYEDVSLRVTGPERVYLAETSLQDALSSLTGIFMVSSGCPTMDKLRPMVRFHLPVATLQETVFRATSSYLLGQYLRARRGLEPDWELAGLEEIYRQVHQVNVGIARSVRRAAVLDANANALVRLDLFTGGVAFSIHEALKGLEYLYAPAYFDEPG